MKSLELVKMAQEMSKVRSIYVLGCWGVPLTYGSNLNRFSNNYDYNKKRASMYSDAVAKAKADGVALFGGDCCGIVKGLLWGWCGDAGKVYGGCNYGSNGMPDTTIYAMLNTHCTDISDDFSNIQPGEFLVYDKEYGHCGLYLGDGLCLESTPKWDNCFQITEVWNIKKTQSKGRKWWKHGKFKIVDYTDYVKPVEPKPEEQKPVGKVKITCPCCGKEIYNDGTKVEPRVYKVGDIVNYKGTTHYTSANATTPKYCKGGLAKITQIYQLGKSKHPYHLVRESGKGATVWGWVDANSFE